MAVLNNVAKLAVKPLPRMFSPKGKAIADYVLSGACLGTAGWFWGRNKRAALAALVCGAAGLAVTLLTDYPGGVKRVISLRKRREIDLGLAAMTATMPEFFAFKGDPEKNFFRAEGVAITVVSELTDFSDSARTDDADHWRAA